MEVGFIFLIVIGVAIALRLVAGGMDYGRIRQYVESRGGEVLATRWSPFGPGWFGEKSDRIYSVRYLDQDGNEHRAHCKTSMLTGVYFTEDRIVRYAEQPDEAEVDVAALMEENRRLREELRRLKGE